MTCLIIFKKIIKSSEINGLSHTSQKIAKYSEINVLSLSSQDIVKYSETMPCPIVLLLPLSLSLDAIGTVCHQFGLLRADLHLIPCAGFVETFY